MGKGIFGKIETDIFFDWREVAIALVKSRGIHDGLWRAAVAFKDFPMMAQVNTTRGAPTGEKVPSILVCVESVHLMQMKPDQADDLTVNAAEVNPRPNLIIPGGMSVQ